MSENIVVAPPAAAAPKPTNNSIFSHARYIVAENPVTGLSFALFVLIALCALFGPYIVPHDPLASDTAAALQAPSLKHWCGTDQLGRDIFSRVIVATRLDFIIAIASVALVFALGGFAGIASGFFGGWTDRIVGRIADTKARRRPLGCSGLVVTTPKATRGYRRTFDPKSGPLGASMLKQG